MIEILHRYTRAVLYASATADTIAEAVVEADDAHADLRGADLTRADLRGADLTRADLTRADLTRADLTRADLRGAALRGADLRDADLRGADLRDADLRGADLRGAALRGADLRDADLRGAALRGADLTRADLRGAALTGADLRGAALRGADLRDADLRGADLRGADLRGAEGLNPNRLSPLRLLREQPGRIRAYKIVTANGEGIYARQGGHTPITYAVGESYAVEDADTDETHGCGAGLHVATLDWCLRKWREGYRILVVEFEAADIAAIPIATDGKFRVRRLTVVREVSLEESGLAQEARDREAWEKARAASEAAKVAP